MDSKTDWELINYKSLDSKWTGSKKNIDQERGKQIQRTDLNLL